MALCGLALCPGPAFAEATIKAYTDRTTVAVNEPFVLVIEVQGGKARALTPPESDELKFSGQTSQEWRMEVSGLSTVQTFQHKFVMTATHTGKITIPAVTAEVGGQQLTSNPVVITVTDASARPAANTTAQQRTGAGSGRLTWDDLAFVENETSKQKAYLGEPVLLTLKLYRIMDPRIQVTLEGKPRYPTAEGFYAVPLQQEREQQNRNGIDYDVTLFRQALYPTSTGTLTIEPWELEVAAGYGFDWRNLQLHSPAITIEVQPLPERPANFSGAVGTFELKARLSQAEVIQGTPVKLIIEVSGTGNPDAIGAPAIPKIENAHLGDPEAENADAEELGPMGIKKTFTYNLVPLQEGAMQIPQVQFCYFDPATESYKTLTAGPLPLQVLKSVESTNRTIVSNFAPAAQKGSVDVIAEDILPLIADPGRLRPRRLPGAVMPAVAALPVAGYVGLTLLLRRKRRFEHDTTYARQYYARNKTEKRLRDVLSSANPTEELYHAISEYIADKLNMAAGGMTSDDARAGLELRGISPELIETFVKIMRKCERARYASVSISPEEASALVQAARNGIARLEGELKKRPAPRRNA
jgi:hypothetical protein